jgi:GT2 family glycosyltransferase
VTCEEARFADIAQPLVSVVIPTRNRLLLLKENLASVEGQSYASWEAIVVDDCSTDETRSWLSGLSDPRLRVIRLPEPSERSAARNRGLEEARGEFILFVDDDDKLTPNALRYLTKWAVRRPNVVAVVGGARAFDGRGHRRRGHHPTLPVQRMDWWKDVVLGWTPVSGQCLIQSIAVRDAGGWDRNLMLSEDYDLWLRLSKVGGAMLVPRVVLECRRHAGQWQPADAPALEERVRTIALKRLENEDTVSLSRMLKTKALRDRAHTEHAQGNFWGALMLYSKTIRSYPWILSSPITGPSLGWTIGKAAAAAVLGGRGVQAAKQLRAGFRTLFRRDPGGTERANVERSRRVRIDERRC